MPSRRLSKSTITRDVKAALAKEPGLTIMELAERVDVNRQFMAGFLAALEERGEVRCRKVGPARIYFAQDLADVARTPSSQEPKK